MQQRLLRTTALTLRGRVVLQTLPKAFSLILLQISLVNPNHFIHLRDIVVKFIFNHYFFGMNERSERYPRFLGNREKTLSVCPAFTLFLYYVVCIVALNAHAIGTTVPYKTALSAQ